MSTSSFPKLEQFFGAYFHQDWPLEASTSAEIVDAYRKKASARALGDLLKELAALRAEKLKEAQLRKRIEALGACIDPSAEGLTCAEWLASVESALQPAAPKATKPRTSR